MKKILLYLFFFILCAGLNAQITTEIAVFNFENYSHYENYTPAPPLILPVIGEGELISIGEVVPQMINGYQNQGRALLFRNFPPNGIAANNETAGLQVKLSTAGRSNIKIQWKEAGSNRSANRTRLKYTVDGETWLPFQANYTNAKNERLSGTLGNEIFLEGLYINNLGGGHYHQRSADLSQIEGVADNPHFGIQIVTAHAYTGYYHGIEDNKANSYSPTSIMRYDDIIITSTAYPTEVSSISALKESPPGNLTVITSEVVITAVIGDILYIQDLESNIADSEISGIKLTDPESHISPDIVLQSGLVLNNLTGELVEHEGIFSFSLKKDLEITDEQVETEPINLTLTEIYEKFELYESMLVRVNKVILFPEEGELFEENDYLLYDGSVDFTLRVVPLPAAPASELLGTPVPTEAIELTGILTHCAEQNQFILAWSQDNVATLEENPDFPPLNLQYSLIENLVVLYWDLPLLNANNPEPESYTVYKNEEIIGEVSDLAFIDLSTTWGSFSYAVSANYPHDVQSVKTEPIIGYIDVVLNPPTNLTFEIDSVSSEVILYWDSPEDSNLLGDFLHYILYRNGTIYTEFVNDNTFFDAEVNEGGIYEYRVVASYSQGESTSSNTVMVEIEVSTSENHDILPLSQTALIGNYPNPFNPVTTIKFGIKNTEPGIDTHPVKIDIFNIKGQKVRELVNGAYPAGEHSVVWNGRDDSGVGVSSGYYFYKMVSGDFMGMGKMLLLK